MATFKETVLRMVADKELGAQQAMALIQRVQAWRETQPSASQRPATRQPVAIIGMAGRFPGADDPEAFWHNLREGRSSVGEIPRGRWDLDALYDPDPQAVGKSYCKWGGFLDDIDAFDSAFFNLSDKEAQLMDPQQRLFLQEASRAMEDAGLSAAALDGARCGVFAGVAGGDFIHRLSDEGIDPGVYAFMGNSSSILAARISFLLNLKGPSIAVDTACSSSLVAIHLACESLSLGTSDLALAGGVCVLNTPNFYKAGSTAGMLSRRGACRTFDRDADGFVPAEGVGVIVLKPLAKAVEEGDHILGVIEGSALNQDGRTNGITAPSAPSQTALELEVYERFAIDPRTIGYVEAHGTGTPLGDPIEIEALTAAFRRYTGENGFCAIGSSKTNIGHAMSASGMAGVIKVLKALEHAELPPSLHFEQENPAIGFAATPFHVNTERQPWPRPAGAPRRAAVSSFGFSGTNAHLVIAQPPARVKSVDRGRRLPFVVSAKSRAALRCNCDALTEWLERNPDASLESVSWTLLSGRNHYPQRVVVEAAERMELIALLRGEFDDTRAEIPDPRTLFEAPFPAKVPLPTYRFEPRNHALGSATRPKRTTAPHPLLDRRTAEGGASRWDGSLPFVRDHRVGDRHIVPGACLVELVLAAGEAGSLEEVAFLSPLEIGAEAVEVEWRREADGGFSIRRGSQRVAQGRVGAADPAPAARLVLDDWWQEPRLDVAALIDRFHAAGVVLGPYCQGLHRLWRRADEALAQLRLPAGEARSLAYYRLHPTLVDGAFQGAMALLAERSDGVLVPASIGRVQVYAPLPAVCYAHIRLTGPRSFDLALVDRNGERLATLERFSVAELKRTDEPALHYYRPNWVEIAAPPAAVLGDGVALVVRAPETALNFSLPKPALEVVLGRSSESLAPGQWRVDVAAESAFDELLGRLKPLGRVLFVAGDGEAVERDLKGLLHLSRALLRRPAAQLGAGQGVEMVVAAPADNAGVLGFAQTLSREEPKLRLTVVESGDPAAAWNLGPVEGPGRILALRDGRLLERQLAEHPMATAGASRFRRGGVYLIAGGAGGLGLALARYLASRYDARVVLLGRRELELELPESVVYRQVDVTDRQAMARLVDEVRARHGAIHGVVHAAMVLRDTRVRNMADEALDRVLAPKVAGSRIIAELFAAADLDFMAFFSSANAFFGNPGQANYAAASMAQDAIARQLAARAAFPVRIVNWGLWGEVGAVATAEHRRRAEEHGIGAIGTEEGLAALERCLADETVQLMPMKVAPAILARMGMMGESGDAAIAAAFEAVENHGRKALRRYAGEDGRLALEVAPRYARLRAALEEILSRPFGESSGEIAEWTRPFVRLIDRCLEHYPEVLAGRMNPAEVLFPGGDTGWVAPLYRDNPIVDRYNGKVAEELGRRVAALLERQPRVRVFEVGSGTGGTSRGVLALLERWGDRVEFVFSDLSAGLVRQAKGELGERYPFSRFVTFDAERAPAEQGIEAGAYDLVLASNVLHATRNIANCLRNVHRLLRDDGVLLLNESIRLFDFSTLTFGLTDGWWLYDDEAARLPHAPLLDEARWRQALAECFERVEISEGDGDAPQAVFIAGARPYSGEARQPVAAVAARAEPMVQGGEQVTEREGDSAAVERVIRRHLAAVLDVGVADVDEERRFSELGVDSITGADLIQRLNAELGTELPVTVLFEFSTMPRLARHLLEQRPSRLPPAEAPPAAERESAAGGAGVTDEGWSHARQAAQENDADQPIAVVGVAGRFPGAESVAAFWRDLRDGRCRVGEVPPERWDVTRYYDPDPGKPGKSPCKWGGFLEDVDKFDPAFFQMSGAEAEYTDPQQRLFVEEAWHALEDAGYAPSWLDGKRCGVFVGAAAGDYVQLVDADDPQPQAFLGNGISMLASRIAYLLNLRGPALAVDTACSSSLLAVHLACQSIRSGESELALAGGVFVSTTPSFHYLTGRLGMLSPSGQCRAFDDRADGFVPGEAVGVVVLKPLAAALRDGDTIHGVIRGSAANQDGHSNGITAPNAVSQAELEEGLYRHCGIDPRTIGYVEAHGTGTRLGDPLEIEGLTRAFRRFTADRQFCAVGSAKSNIGHAGPAAGIVGLIKVLLAMRHREIPPSLHFERANTVIDFPASPFYVAAERTPWGVTPMRAAVSAFGLSGTNVHLVVDEPPPPAPAAESPAAGEVALFPVSAMSEAALAERVSRLEAWLDGEGAALPARDIAYTLAACRKHFAHRAVVRAPAGHPLVARYLAGEAIDWAALYPAPAHRRVSLPGYPFSRERYWVAEALPPARQAERQMPAQPIRLFARRWVEAAGTPAAGPDSVAVIGADEMQRARLAGLLGVPVGQEPRAASAVVLMPGCYDSLERYLEIARQAAGVRRVLVLHHPAEHAAVASAALHHSLHFVHPGLSWQTLEVGADPLAEAADELRLAVDAAELRRREGPRQAHGIAPLTLPETTPPLRRGGVWWISGGAGRLGLRVAAWLVAEAGARVIVTSRHAPEGALPAGVTFRAADVTDRGRMRAVFEAIRAEHGTLHGVIHAAGFIDPPLLTAKHDSRAVLAPKIDGARLLDELTRDLTLDAFVLFSSLSALVGDFGQCDYAAANRYLESFAQWRASRRPGRTVAIHWPLWADGGMRPVQESEQQMVAQSGYEALDTRDGLALLGRAIAASEEAVITVVRGDTEGFEALMRPGHGAGRPTAAPAQTGEGGGPKGDLSTLEGIVLRGTAEVVRLPVEKLSRDSRFAEVGLDSLYMKDLAAKLEAELGMAITPTAFFQHQTVAALAGHLHPSWEPRVVTGVTEATTSTSAPTLPVSEARDPDEPVAIIGMSGRFPQSEDLEQLWAHLVAGDDCITEIPAERWDWRDYQPAAGREQDTSASRWGGFMPGIRHFDCAFFGISPREAVFMDPQHRLFLQTTWQAFEDAGIRPSDWAGRPVGIWAGVQPNEYMGLMGDVGEAKAQAALGNTQTMLANRASYWFDFRGPSQTVDTACSSSLVALHRAVESLRRGECELAVAGGVSVILSPDNYVLASRMGMLSADGRCKTFDASANGYVKGEGVGVLLLKPLARAVADGDTIHGVIRGTAEGHGGRSSSLTAPNPEAQAELIFNAWQRAGVPIDSVGYVEAHGTGTELGDPIEVEALGAAFTRLAEAQGVTLPRGGCALGAIKSNIGHLEPASGVAGVIKVLLAMRHGVLPPTLHVRQVNPYLKLEDSPFRLVRERGEWRGETLRAGVSAFGFGGSNAHVALESAPAPQAPAEEADALFAVVPVSAKSAEALRRRVVQLRDFLGRQPVRWRDLVFTLQQGRERFPHAIGIGADSVPAFVAQCNRWLAGEALEGDHGEGVSVLHGRRIPLPTYPFEPTPIWFGDHKPAAAPARVVAAPCRVEAAAAVVTRSPSAPAPRAAAAGGGGCLPRLKGALAELLYLRVADIADDAAFVELGLDSILAVEFAKTLQEEFGVDLRAARLYDHASVADLAAQLDRELAAGGGEEAAEAVPETPPQPEEIEEAAPAASEASRAGCLERIRAMLAELLYLREGDIADDAAFAELGLDSILAVEFAKKLQDGFGIDLQAARLYDHATVIDLAIWVADAISGEQAEAAPPVAEVVVSPADDKGDEVPSAETAPETEPETAPEPATQPSADPASAGGLDGRDGDIAIIGMAARFPGADDVARFWRNLADGVDSVTEVPAERWSVPDKVYCRKGGFIDGVDRFDPLFFNISPQEAEWMDPQQRLFLEQAWLALEDAGLPGKGLGGSRCAVFAGAGQGDYFRLMDPESEGGAQFGMGNVGSILAARISYFLNLKGPAVSLDTACSSSLVATHLAARALRDGECDLALSGGVSLMLTPQMHRLTSQARMLSPEGQCKTFDAEADGFVPGEGVGVVVLKRLRDALADGDRIHAVIRGSGTSQDGRTQGITAPSAQSQANLMLEIYRRHAIDPATITCVEAHGTGTKLGDPIEVSALTEAFRHFTAERHYCAIGSVKSNIGHTLPAAGIAGLIKGVLMLEARQIAPTLHCRAENPEIDFERSPFFVNRQLREWTPPPGVPRRVAVSSFGFSGTNAHVVIEEWPRAPAPRAEPTASGPWSFPLSARTGASLRQAADRLANWLERDGARLALHDVAFTLASRREQHAISRVVNARHRQELIDKLRQDAPSDAAQPAPRAGRVVSLPPYPFDRRRFWVPEEERPPLLDRLEQRFAEATVTTRLGGEHALMADHVVAGTPTLPGAAYLEIALAAGAELAPRGGAAPSLRDVVWMRPFQPPEETLSTRFTPAAEGIDFASPFCRGRVAFAEVAPPPRIEPGTGSGESFDQEAIYAAFAAMGLHYGESMRNLASLRRDGSRVVAELELPADFARYRLDPRVVDAALQTPIGFALGKEAAGPAYLPYRLERVVRHGPLVPGCRVVTTLREGELPCFDIAIVSPRGEVLVELGGLSSLALPETEPEAEPEQGELRFFTPRHAIVPAPAPAVEPAGAVLLLYGETARPLVETLTRQYEAEGSNVHRVRLGESWQDGAADADLPEAIDCRAPDDWRRLTDRIPVLDRVVHLGGLADGPLLDGAALEAFHEAALLPVARFIRARVAGERLMPALVLVTNGTQRVLEGEPTWPQAASLEGLSGTVAKEFPGVEVAHLDLDAGAELADEALAERVRTASAGSFVYRNGQCFVRNLEAVQLPSAAGAAAPPFREGGVYVIFGGLGGIGREVGQWLADSQRARIVLVGRREVDDEIGAALDGINAGAGEAIYLSADIGDPAAVAAVRDAVLERWGAVHGVIHSALSLRDQSLARLEDESFRRTLHAKGRGTCVLMEAFREVALDWLLLFSSTISFTQNAGQASYSAASTLQDALAAAFAPTLPWPVKTINWGYWGEVGVVATDRHREIARSRGVGSLTLPDALEAIAHLLASELEQMAVIRMLDAPPRELSWRRNEGASEVAHALDATPPVPPMSAEMEALRQGLVRLEACGRRILGQRLESLDAAEVVAPYRGLHAWVRRYAEGGADAARANRELAAMLGDARLAPFAKLLEMALTDLPLVVTGRKSATDVLFPAGSAQYVEAVYRADALVHEHQRRLGALIASLARRPLALLEVGGGTGAMTRAILAAVGNGGEAVDYHWTDLSPHFVHQAEEAWGGRGMAMRFSVLDLEREPLAQGVEAGSYDLVVAANVVHATASIADTLQRIKKLLKRGGLLVLDEMAGRSDFSSMTFGLTEGWWRFRDAERRQPLSPLLSTAQWRAALNEAGFRNVRCLAAEEGSGSAIVVAESDGWFKDVVAAEDAGPAAAADGQGTAAVPAASPPVAGSDLEFVRSVVAAVLRTLDEELRNDTPFDSYGVDSLVAVDILERLKPRYGQLPPTLLFKYNTISALAGHLSRQGEPEEEEGARALLTLREAGQGPRTFWVHSVLGETDWVARLMEHLPASWPLHALRYPFTPPGGEEGGFTSLEAMAEGYLAEIRAVQPHGPYVLGGYSFGGAVAYEIGRQLIRAGESVRALILLDAFAPESAVLRSLQDASWDGFLDGVIGAMLRLTRKEPPTREEIEQVSGRLLAVAHRCAPLLDGYQPEPCPMNALLLRNRHSFVGPESPLGIPPVKIDDDEPDHGWGQWLGGTPPVVELESDHFGLGLEPTIGEVARQVEGFLEPTAEFVLGQIRDQVGRILPDVEGERVLPTVSLTELGANSLDRVEVAVCTMEALQLKLPQTELARVGNVGGLVDLFLTHLQRRGGGGFA